MKKFFLLSIMILLTSFKDYQADSGLTFDYEIKYKMDNKEFSVFVSKSNSKDFLMSMTTDFYNNNLYSFLQDTRFFKLRISDSNEVDWSSSEYEGDPSNQQFNELVEANETKIINNIKCNRYIAKSPIVKSQFVEVYISKNNKINNVNFLLSLRTKTNSTIKGLVMELNSINNKTNEIKSVLTLNEIKQTKKTIKFDNENLNKLIKKEEYHKKHENNETITAEIVGENETKSSNKAERNYKRVKFKDGDWSEYAKKNFKFKSNDSIGTNYIFNSYCVISKEGVITKIEVLHAGKYKEDYIKFLNSVKDRWIPAEEYGKKVESADYITVRIVK